MPKEEQIIVPVIKNVEEEKLPEIVVVPSMKDIE